MIRDDLCEGGVRFVGICEDIETVLKTHRSLVENKDLNDWVTSRIRSNFIPIVEILEEFENGDGEDYLRYWIGVFRGRGHVLFNK